MDGTNSVPFLVEEWKKVPFLGEEKYFPLCWARGVTNNFVVLKEETRRTTAKGNVLMSPGKIKDQSLYFAKPG